MGIIVEGTMIRKKHRERIKIALDGREVFGMKEEKEWVPNQKITYLPVQNVKTKERVEKDGKKEEVVARRIGWSKFDHNLKTSFQLHNRSQTGRTLLRDGRGKFWNVKEMKWEKKMWIPKDKTPDTKLQIKMLYPTVGQVVNVQGTDYQYIGKTREGQWKLKQDNKIRKIASSRIKDMIKKMELSIVTKCRSKMKEGLIWK